MTAMTGGEAVYHALRALEVDHVFGIVSVHNLPIYDAIHRRSEEHTSELQSRTNLVCRLLLEKKKFS